MKNRLVTNESEWNYSVSLTNLKTVDKFGNILESKKATVDESTGSILGVVSSHYRLIQNKTLFDVMTEVGTQLNLNLTSVSVCKNKGLTIFKYGFGEEHNRVIENSTEKNDSVKFGIEVLNSFDSRWGGGRFRAFAERLVCLNGMTLPREVASFYFSSIPNFDNFSNSVIDTLGNRISPIIETANIWNSWAKIVPNRVKVGEFISGSLLNQEVSKNILDKYDTGKDQTLWGLYNLVTYHITHEAVAENPRDLRYRQYTLERVADKFYEEVLV